MKTGTKSILFGVHCFFLHPLMVAIAWIKLYGWPSDYRIWLAFFVHDLGYWGCSNMDDEEGERHVLLGANIMQKLFGDKWGYFTMYHSRFYARKDNRLFSQLCIADKYAIIIEPRWFYLFRATLSGEIYEYMNTSKYSGMICLNHVNKIAWYDEMKSYMKYWVLRHKNIYFNYC